MKNSITAIFIFLSIPLSLNAQQSQDSIIYLNPFERTHLMDDYRLLLQNKEVFLDEGPFFYSHIWESAIGLGANTEPAYFQFDDELYKAGPNASLKRLQLFTAASRINFRPISAGPINYEAYYMEMSLDDTKLLGLKAIEYGFLERLKLNTQKR